MPLLAGLIVFELVVMVLAISLHDCAQAWAADRLGDPTGRLAGRLTMNPVPHFDLFGTAILPLLNIFLFHSSLVLGWGKPVPMLYRNFREKNGEFLATLAGPAAQFAAALVSLVLLVLFKHFLPGGGLLLQIAEFTAHRAPIAAKGMLFPLMLFLYVCILENLLLFVFNLMPLPFLDGGKILVHFLPYNAAKAFEQYSLYIMIAFFLLGSYLINFIFGPLSALFDGLLYRL